MQSPWVLKRLNLKTFDFGLLHQHLCEIERWRIGLSGDLMIRQLLAESFGRPLQVRFGNPQPRAPPIQFD